jgi:hypothetical protein
MSEIKGLQRLREPFLENQVSKLPKPTCDLSTWRSLPKASCAECGAYHATTKTIHLPYVGHAALTDRLLDADPGWTWEPLAYDAQGLPLIDNDGGMWIKLTVCGVTRFGYGDAQGKTGGNATKERIGDALRNAAMRFGAALDLWHKGELHADESEPVEEKKTTLHAQSAASAAFAESKAEIKANPLIIGVISEGQCKLLYAKLKAAGLGVGMLKEALRIEHVKDLARGRMNEALEWIAKASESPAAKGPGNFDDIPF